VEHTQIHPALKRGTKNFHYTTILVGFLVNSLFHETKIPTVDMKVQVCSKFRKFPFGKKVKSPLRMNFGRISTSKYRGRHQKMGCCTRNGVDFRPTPTRLEILYYPSGRASVFFFFFCAEYLDSFSNLVLISKKDSFLSPRLIPPTDQLFRMSSAIVDGTMISR
jgi:hypothetical protein